MIEIVELGIRFEDYVVFENISLAINDAEFFVVLGPSGCGKTTLLNAIAGFIKPYKGHLRVAGSEVTRPGADRSVIFQNTDAALFPWKTVWENSEFGLQLSGRGTKDVRENLIRTYLKKTNLDGHEHKYPHELSGGMKQRLQLVRTLVMDPPILLMDEPFANLDAQTKRYLQLELVDICKDSGKTVFFITHDLNEAVILGQRVAVMSAGPHSGIKNIYEITQPYPRDLTTGEFRNVLSSLNSDLEEESNAEFK